MQSKIQKNMIDWINRYWGFSETLFTECKRVVIDIRLIVGLFILTVLLLRWVKLIQ
jgi:hypothetical protein